MPSLNKVIARLFGIGRQKLFWKTLSGCNIRLSTTSPVIHIAFAEHCGGEKLDLDLLAEWVPDEALRKRILVDNPEQVYGFPRSGLTMPKQG